MYRTILLDRHKGFIILIIIVIIISTQMAMHFVSFEHDPYGDRANHGFLLSNVKVFEKSASIPYFTPFENHTYNETVFLSHNKFLGVEQKVSDYV
jgi:hypothetical protein